MKRTTRHRIQVAPDKEVHTSFVKSELHENEMVEVREFIPSLKKYGRGLVVQKGNAVKLARALNEMGRE